MRTVILALLLLLATSQTATAELGWEQLQTKLRGAPGYQMNYHFKDGREEYYFLYTVINTGPRVLTEILDGSSRGRGTKILFDPQVNNDVVLMKTPFLTLRRSITAKDIRDTSLYIPLFAQLLDRTRNHGATVESPGVFVVDAEQVRHRWTVDASSGDPLSYQRFQGGELVESMSFTNLTWGDQFVLKL